MFRGARETSTGELRLDPAEVELSKVLAYLVAWSFTDDGQPLPIDQIDLIDPESFREILQAIEAHIDAMAAERAAEKKAADGVPTSPAIAPSPSGPAGVSSGSVN